ncbi:MAG: transposase [Pyrinomonadaceae bacterium]
MGIEPVENESAGKSKNKGISRAGSSLARFLLGQSANIVARYDARIQGFLQAISQEKAKTGSENRDGEKSFGQTRHYDAGQHHRPRV